MPDQKRHLLIPYDGIKERFISPKGGSSREFRLFGHDREAHGQELRRQLEEVQRGLEQVKTNREALGLRGDFGLYLEFETEPNFELKYDSLDDLRSGIELQNIKDVGGITYATVYVPEGKLANFFRMVEKYLTEIDARTGEAKNKKLLENIAAVRLASLKAFWTDVDNFDSIPEDEPIWWEVWLRAGSTNDDRLALLDSYLSIARESHIDVREHKLMFPERTVILSFATKRQLSSSVLLLNCLAELRRPHDTADIFIRMSGNEQREWADDLLARTNFPQNDAVAVCLLDHGVNNSHPLLQRSLLDADMHTYDPNWGKNDTHPEGHGTGMAGLALYGDLFDVLANHAPVALAHRLESVKIIELNHQHAPDLYGHVTKECIARAESSAPQRKRAICLTVASKETRFLGTPTAWSSAIDQSATGSGEDDEPRRLILVSAGNTDFHQLNDYPFVNQLEDIHDPAQAWNAVTIGAYTSKVNIDQATWPGWVPLAPSGGLCPSSTTSIKWNQNWPIKPDVVLEGGNAARNNGTGDVDFVDSLQLLTTAKETLVRLFSATGDTSAATALASRLAAIVQTQYHDFWPETVRGLLIHSADWTSEMLSGLDLRTATKRQKQVLLRTVGYGVADLERALWSAGNALTLIAQDSLLPFMRDSGDIKTNQISIYSLPWPVDVLQQLGAIDVELRITLSYFIEPNPSNRKFVGKFDYASHGLRFDLKNAAEDPSEFKRRVNKLARDAEVEENFTGVNWVLGPQVRNVGSIHSDIWRGSAADLALMNTIAVYPVTGWWKTRKKLEKWNSSARFALIVTLRTQSEEVDLYTPVANMLQIPIEVRG